MSKQILIAHPKEPTTLEQLIQAVRSWLTACVLHELDHATTALTMRDYHRRAYYFGVRNLPKFPTAATMTAAEAEGFLIELKQALGDDRPYVFFDPPRPAGKITFEDIQIGFDSHQQQTRQAAARAVNRTMSVGDAAKALCITPRHAQRLVKDGMPLTAAGVEEQRKKLKPANKRKGDPIKATARRNNKNFLKSIGD